MSPSIIFLCAVLVMMLSTVWSIINFIIMLVRAMPKKRRTHEVFNSGMKITAIELSDEEKEALTVPKEAWDAMLEEHRQRFGGADRPSCVDHPIVEQRWIDASVAAKKASSDRPRWPEVWMNIAREISRRSYDKRLQVGCVVVPEDNTAILGLGYNGNAEGLPNEAESDEPGKSGMLHAEVNSLIKCDFSFPKKKIMYVTHSPCRQCAKLIINARIARVVYGELYRDASSVEMLRSAGIEVRSLDEALGD